MAFRIIIDRRAFDDIDDAVGYYHKISPALSVRISHICFIILSMKKTIELIPNKILRAFVREDRVMLIACGLNNLKPRVLGVKNTK